MDSANASFAVLCHNDFGRVAAALPSSCVDLATEQALTACDARLFVCTASWDANVNRLHATAWVAQA